MTRTPLTLYAVFLSQRFSVSPPSFSGSNENQLVRDYIRSALEQIKKRNNVPQRTKERLWEIYSYLIAASDPKERQPHRPNSRWHDKDFSTGSLKNILWALREGAGELYEASVFGLFSRLVDNPHWPLGVGLRKHIINDSFLGTILQSIESRPSKTHRLQVEKVGPYVVAFNFSPDNLLSRSNAHLYAAWSDRGGVLKASLDFPSFLLDEIAGRIGGEWAAPYPNLRVIRKRPSLSPDEFRSAVVSVLSSVSEAQH